MVKLKKTISVDKLVTPAVVNISSISAAQKNHDRSLFKEAQ